MFTDVTSWTAKLRDRPEAGLGDQKDGPRAWHAAREIRFSAGCGPPRTGRFLRDILMWLGPQGPAQPPRPCEKLLGGEASGPGSPL